LLNIFSCPYNGCVVDLSGQSCLSTRVHKCMLISYNKDAQKQDSRVLSMRITDCYKTKC